MNSSGCPLEIGYSVETVCQAAHPLTGKAGDYDSLLDLIGNARFVLIGEALVDVIRRN